MSRNAIIFISIVLLPLLCRAQFEDITARAGLQHNCATGAIMGGGAAFVDYDMDGWLDMVFIGGESPDRLYRNNTDGTFEDVSELLTKQVESDLTTGVLVGDLNSDGCPDLVFTTWNDDGIDFILTNDCNGNFLLENENTLFKSANAMGGTLYDFNQDGLLDIYIANYVEEAVFLFDDNNEVNGFDHTPASNHLYINQGDMVFTEQSEEYGVASLGCALAVTVIPTPDKTGRGLYVANDFGEWVYPNEFFELGESLPYAEKASDYGLDIGIYSMGIGIGDLDNDLNFDLHISNLGSNSLLINDGTRYTNRASEMGVENEFAPDGLFTTSWGTFFFDVNNDRWQDLYVANGFINSPDFIKTSFIDPNQLYLNLDGQLIDRGSAFGVANAGINRGSVYGDIDNDGDLDILTAYINFEPSDNPDRHYKLYENRTPNNNFLDIDLVATSTASDAYGSILEITADDQKSIAYKYSGGTHTSQSSQLVHIGIDEAEIVDSVEIFWPSLETRSIIRDIPANTRLQVVEGQEGYEVIGCTDPEADNFNPLATINSGCLQNLSTSTNDIVNKDGGFTTFYAHGRLEIQSESAVDFEYILSDLNGRSIVANQVNSQDFENINLPPLPNGIYYLSIYTDFDIYTIPVFIFE